MHTPGPWTVVNGCNILAEPSQPAPYIAVTGGLTPGVNTIERDAANARLIATSPKMLNIVSLLANVADQPDFWMTMHEAERETMRNLAVSAKAIVAEINGAAR